MENARDLVYNLDLFPDGPDIVHRETMAPDPLGFRCTMLNFYTSIGFGGGGHLPANIEQKGRLTTPANVHSKASGEGIDMDKTCEREQSMCHPPKRNQKTSECDHPPTFGAFLAEREDPQNRKGLDAKSGSIAPSELIGNAREVRSVSFSEGEPPVKRLLKQGRKRYTCTFCGHERSNRDALLAHVRIEHEKVPPMSCNFCFFKTQNRESLRRHDCRTVFQCTICARKMSSSQALENHAGVHKPAKFKCKVCGKCLKQKQGLQRHLKRYHK